MKGRIVGRFAVGAAAAALVFAGCGSDSDSSSGSTGSGDGGRGDYRVYASLSLSGPLAAIGTAEQDGLKAAAEVLNENGGLDGRRVVLDIADDGSDPTQAVSLLQRKVTGDDKPDLVWPGSTSNVTLALCPILMQQRVLALGITASTDIGDLDRCGYNFVMGPTPADSQGAVAETDGRARLQKGRRAALQRRLRPGRAEGGRGDLPGGRAGDHRDRELRARRARRLAAAAQTARRRPRRAVRRGPGRGDRQGAGESSAARLGRSRSSAAPASPAPTSPRSSGPTR